MFSMKPDWLEIDLKWDGTKNLYRVLIAAVSHDITIKYHGKWGEYVVKEVAESNLEEEVNKVLFAIRAETGEGK